MASDSGKVRCLIRANVFRNHSAEPEYRSNVTQFGMSAVSAVVMFVSLSLPLLHASPVPSRTQWDTYSALGPDEYSCVVSRLGTSDYLTGIVRLSFQVKNSCKKPVRFTCSFQANGTALPRFDERLAPGASTDADKHSAILPRASQYTVEVSSTDCDFSFGAR